MKRFLVVIGTRPCAIKLAPVIHALESQGATVDVLFTGQHGDILGKCLDSLRIKPTVQFFRFNGSPLAYRVGRMICDIADRICCEHYDAVVVVGDTISGMAGAMAGAFADVPVAHVEAGLRTHYREPWPEEMIRRSIDSMATWCFAPTKAAWGNLLREGIDDFSIWHTGNTVVDSLRDLGIFRNKSPLETVLVTIHRRENWKHVPEVAALVGELAARFPHVQFSWPVHANPEIAGTVRGLCSNFANITLSDPLPYDLFMQQLAAAHLVITDSGGIQEEAAVLGVPTLVIRSNTERPEAIAAGVSKLETPLSFFKTAERLLGNPAELSAMERTTDAFGDGHAGERIAEVLVYGDCRMGELPL